MMSDGDSRRSQEQALVALHQAALAIASELSLEKTLKQIVDSARPLVGARYAALGVFDDKGQMTRFVFSGISEEEAVRVGHNPEGLGLLRAIIEEARAIRTSPITSDPRSVGFPPGHPKMTSFLGMPIQAGEAILGNIYLTDKEGAEAFSAGDETLIAMLATHAAIAIQNARLFQALQEHAQALEERNQELAALNAVARAVSSKLDLEAVLAQALEQVMSVTGMEVGEVFLLEEATEDMVLMLHRGPSPEAFQTRTRFKRGEGFPGRVAELGQPLATTALKREVDFLRNEVIEAGYRSFACLPLKAKDRVIGTLDLASRDARWIEERGLGLLEAIGSQIGVAVDNARLYQQVGQLAVSEERMRIGMDLHDGVIQSVYAVGLTLETVGLMVEEEPQRARLVLDQAIKGLNDAIRDMRNLILDLRPRRFEGDLVQGLARLVREFQVNAMVEVKLEAPPEVVSGLPPSMAHAFFLTAQEALANVARHARAAKVEVAVRRNGQGVELAVCDDGLGFDLQAQAETVGHGLSNMRSRAEEFNGDFSVRTSPGEGTEIRLTLPLLAS